jgi:hypothetical protein
MKETKTTAAPADLPTAGQEAGQEAVLMADPEAGRVAGREDLETQVAATADLRNPNSKATFSGTL